MARQCQLPYSRYCQINPNSARNCHKATDRTVTARLRRTAEQTLSGLDQSQRLQNSHWIYMARFSGPGDHSGLISYHFRRFGDLGRTHYLRLQHWRSTFSGRGAEYDLTPYHELLRCLSRADFSNLACLPAGGLARQAGRRKIIQ